MNDNLWSWLGVAAVAYLAWRFLKGKNRPQLTVMDGGRKGGRQYQIVEGDTPGFPGTTPQLSVLGWPNDGGGCKC